jgi:hypothetical protein
MISIGYLLALVCQGAGNPANGATSSPAGYQSTQVTGYVLLGLMRSLQNYAIPPNFVPIFVPFLYALTGCDHGEIVIKYKSH